MQAPDTFQVRLECSNGDVVIDIDRAASPNGVDRFYELVKEGVFTDARFFRVVTKPRPFIIQFGIPGDPEEAAKWRDSTIADDPVTQSNSTGTLTFATAGPNTRTSQLFINLGDNDFLDGQGFSPFGKVTEGMDVVNAINDEYGEAPDQGMIQMQGNAYLKDKFPNLDYIKQAVIVE